MEEGPDGGPCDAEETVWQAEANKTQISEPDE
jgi:hypothetical protein